MTSPPISSPQPAAPKHKVEEITEEEMIAWLELDEKDKKDPKEVSQAEESFLELHATPKIDPEPIQEPEPIPSPEPIQEPETEQPTNNFHENHSDSEKENLEPPTNEISDFDLQIRMLDNEFAKSNTTTPQHLVESSDSNLSDDGYVLQQVHRIEETEVTDVKEKRKSRRNRTASDARVSVMIKRTNEMEQQFNTYIETLTEAVNKNEKTLDSVHDLLYQMIKRIDEGQLDLIGARRYAKKALDVIVADAKKHKERSVLFV